MLVFFKFRLIPLLLDPSVGNRHLWSHLFALHLFPRGIGLSDSPNDLHDIYSFLKLTGEGVTLVGSDLVHILEEVLPAHFGGTPLDYQWLEEEDGNGYD